MNQNIKTPDLQYQYQNICDLPVTYANYANRINYQNYAEQDIVYVFQKNLEAEESKTIENDMIGVSTINLPKGNRVIPKELNNFYNCVYSHKQSYFKETKNLITHPGSVSNWEYRISKENSSFLATTNEHLHGIFIWNIYNTRNAKFTDEKTPDVADYFLEFPQHTTFESYKWCRGTNPMIASISDNDNDNNGTLLGYQFNINENQLDDIEIEEENITERALRSRKLKKQPYLVVPILKTDFPITNFVLNNNDEKCVFGTGLSQKFMLNLNSPKDLKRFPEDDKIKINSNRSEEIDNQYFVDFNHENYVVFSSEKKKSIELYDIRKENELLIRINFESKIKKIEFNPFNLEQLIALFQNYVVKINVDSTHEIYVLAKKKIYDFSYSQWEENEFLFTGDSNEQDHFYAGFLNVNKFI